MTTFAELREKLSIPLIVAPMFLVSNPKMALAACREGILGTFPAHCTRTRDVFEDWLKEMDEGFKEPGASSYAPFGVNLVVHPTNARCEGDLELCIKYKVPVVLTSKGAPGDTFKKIHDYGGIILHDVASKRHAEKALAAGADGLIAVCGGAGGHTGTINPFSLVNEIRQLTDKPIVLAGGMTTGRDILAAQVMGADLVYMGTRFIATHEANVTDEYRQMLCDTNATDVFFTAALDGAPANWLRPSLLAAGIDLDELVRTPATEVMSPDKVKGRYKNIYSAGHGVGNIHKVESVTDICRELKSEYGEAVGQLGGLQKLAS